ncbi:hypothetical protein JXA80_08205, partial [bacterium]|nr:hypothetical protein [candidate division CSSED10-310 bacterium]
LAGAAYFSYGAGMSGLLFQHMVHLPIALFAATGLEAVLNRIPRLRTPTMTALVAFFLIPNACTIRHVTIQTGADVWPTSLYWTRGEIDAAIRLRSMPPGHVLSTRDNGNKIGWLALHHVLLGHWGTTPHKGAKQSDMERFFSDGVSMEEKNRILKHYSIRYVWYGEKERRLGSVDWRLPLIPVIRNDAVTVFDTEDPLRVIRSLPK